MKKVSVDEQATHHCGIDVSGETLAVAIQQVNQKFVHRSFENLASGHVCCLGTNVTAGGLILPTVLLVVWSLEPA